MNRNYISLGQFITEIVSYIMLAASFVIAAVQIASIDGEIPTHYTVTGEVDGYGSPWVLIIMPVSMLLVNLLMSWTLHFSNPAKWNAPFKIKQENAILVYHDICWMYVLLDVCFAIMALVFVSTLASSGKASFICSILMIFILIPIIAIPTVKAGRDNKRQ